MFLVAAACIMSIHNGWRKEVDQPEEEGGTLVMAFLYLIVVPAVGTYLLGGGLYLIGFPIYILMHYMSVDWDSPGLIISFLVWVLMCPGMFPVLVYCEMLYETMSYWWTGLCGFVIRVVGLAKAAGIGIGASILRPLYLWVTFRLRPNLILL